MMQTKLMAGDKLTRLYQEAPIFPLRKSSRYIVFSDLHILDRSKKDDFQKNARLLYAVLDQYYFPRGYTLILNGDIEDLLLGKNEDDLREAYREDIYPIFTRFALAGRLLRIRGNHDINARELPPFATIYPAIRLHNPGKAQTIFIYHGHQLDSINNGGWNPLLRRLLQVAYAIGISNYSVSHDSRKKYKVEKAAYEFSRREEILSLLGHTHRALFESRSKLDFLKYSIEKLLEEFGKSKSPAARSQLRVELKKLWVEFKHVQEKPKYELPEHTYSEEIFSPNLFNSGCCIGKKGITGLEISRGKISLLSWSSAEKYKKYFAKRERKGYPEREEALPLPDQSAYCTVLRSNALQKIFSRIKALQGLEF